MNVRLKCKQPNQDKGIATKGSIGLNVNTWDILLCLNNLFEK